MRRLMRPPIEDGKGNTRETKKCPDRIGTVSERLEKMTAV